VQAFRLRYPLMLALLALEATMAAMTIRNIPDQVRDKLRVRGARHGWSMEAEARAILTAAVSEQGESVAPDLQQWVKELYGKRKPKRVVRSLIAERRRESRRK
jgi:plasmid stability protein